MNTQKTQNKLHRLQISNYLLWIGCFIAVLFSGCSNETPVHPNVILIQFDDLGYNDIGIHGNPVIETPNLDNFAKKSAQFTQFYVNPDTAFFAYLSFLTCHRPLVAPEAIVAKYIEKDLPEELATLYAMVEHADSALGEFFHFLEEKKLMDNSLVMIMSDNGTDYDAFRDQSIRDLRKVNHLRGYKGDIWENGVISPLFIRWGENIQTGEINFLTDVTDVLPTLMDLCDIEMPEEHLPLDGQSFGHVLLNENANLENDKIVVNYAHRSWPPAIKHQVFLEDQYRPLSYEEINSLPMNNHVISYREGSYKLLLNPNNPIDFVSAFCLT